MCAIWRSGHPDGGIALTHEDAVVARQVVIADQDDAAPALIFADRAGGLIGKADFGPGRSLHRAAQHAVELDPLLADLDLGLPGTFGKSPPRRRFAPPARRRSDASAAKRRSTPFTGRDSVKATKKFSMLLSLKIKQIGANAAGAPHKKSKKKLQTKKNVIPLHSQ